MLRQFENPPSCNICGIGSFKLVKDHDHKTGYIRASLCVDCNHCLGVFERLRDNQPLGFLQEKLFRRKKYSDWLEKFSDKIKFHLTCNTGVLYREQTEFECR